VAASGKLGCSAYRNRRGGSNGRLIPMKGDRDARAGRPTPSPAPSGRGEGGRRSLSRRARGAGQERRPGGADLAKAIREAEGKRARLERLLYDLPYEQSFAIPKQMARIDAELAGLTAEEAAIDAAPVTLHPQAA
jgi:hypothetical protein